MEVFEGDINKLGYGTITKEIKRGKNGYNLLKNIDFDNKSILPFLVITGIFSLFFFNITWNDSIWLFIAIIVYSILAAGLFLTIKVSYLYYNKDVIVIYKDAKFFYFPVKGFLTCKNYSTDSKKKVTLYFLNGTTFDFYYNGKIDLFISTLLQTSKASQEGLIQDNNINLLDLFNSIKPNSRVNNHAIKKYVLVIVTIATILLLSAPFMLDRNGYRDAVKTNTASSFRGYLIDNKNFIYRDEVKRLLIEKYNYYINQYKTKYSNSYPVQSLITILEYLRNNDLDAVNISFQNFNNLHDLKKNIYVVSVMNTINQQFILEREKELIKRLNQTLGKIFPTDIIKIDESSKSTNIPNIGITYSYSNSDVTYYNSNEEKVNEQNRTYYYGIMILWDFKMFMPNNSNPVYSFSLESTPSPTFHSQGSGEGNVYSYMIYSAFDNFAKAYEDHFFN